MCFSSTASFVAGGALSATGVATVRKAKKHELPLASIPFFFGIQQLADGLVWISPVASTFHLLGAYAYGFFAFVFWPTFSPLAVLMVEKNHSKRNQLQVLLLLGLGVSSFFLYHLVTEGVTAQVLHSCVAYNTPHPYDLASLSLYLVAVVGAFLVSSKKLLKLFGILVFISFLIAGWFYLELFASVWCFCAGVLSFILLLYFLNPKRK